MSEYTYLEPLGWDEATEAVPCRTPWPFFLAVAAWGVDLETECCSASVGWSLSEDEGEREGEWICSLCDQPIGLDRRVRGGQGPWGTGLRDWLESVLESYTDVLWAGLLAPGLEEDLRTLRAQHGALRDQLDPWLD